MAPAAGSGSRTVYQIMAFIAAGIILGCMHVLGLLASAGFVLFLAGSVVMMLFRSLYHRLWLLGILLLACVVVEPSPSDALFCAAFPLGLLSGEFRPKTLGKAFPAVALLIAYCVASLPGLAQAVDFNSAVRYFLITVYLFAFSVLLCMYADPGNILSLLRVYVLAGLLSFAAGLAGMLGIYPDLLMADAFRVRGLFKDPNVYGPFFVPAIILLLDDVHRKRIWRLPRAAHWAGIALMSLGVVFSYSRAAWISLAASVFLYGLLYMKTVRPARIAGMAVIVVIVLVLAGAVLLTPALQSTGFVSFIMERAQLQDYDSNRFTTQQGGIELVLRHPLGVGPGQFENEIYKITGKRLSSHSLYVRTVAENGIAGGLLFIAAMLYLLLRLWLLHRRSVRPYGASPPPSPSGSAQVPLYDDTAAGIAPSALIAILSGILVNSLVVDTLHWRHFWFFIGIGLYIVREWGKQVKDHE